MKPVRWVIFAIIATAAGIAAPTFFADHKSTRDLAGTARKVAEDIKALASGTTADGSGAAALGADRASGTRVTPDGQVIEEERTIDENGVVHRRVVISPSDQDLGKNLGGGTRVRAGATGEADPP